MPVSEVTELVALRVIIAVAAAAAGGIAGVLGKRTSHSVLCGLVSFAAGALLAVTLVHILPEAAMSTGWLKTSEAAAAGLLSFYLIGRFVYFICPACSASASEEHRGYLTMGILLMITLAVHSTVDGIAIAAGARSAPLVGILILVAISYHKVPEGLALVSVVRLAGFGRYKALLLTVLIEFTTGLGAFLGLVLLEGLNEFHIGLVLALVAGSFLYVVGFALIKEMWEHERRSIVIYVVLGFVFIVVLGLALSAYGIGEHG
jgi:ZIP family zinc transporter